jgi:hypothetical protein
MKAPVPDGTAPDAEYDLEEKIAFVLGDLAFAALDWPKGIPETQRDFAQRAIDSFPRDAERLMQVLRQLPSTDQNDAFGALARLLDATMHIAGSASASKAAKLYHEFVAQSTRGSKPRRPTKIAQRIDELAAKFSHRRNIVKAVLDNWGEETTVPNQRTVERHLQKTKPKPPKAEGPKSLGLFGATTGRGRQ